MNDISTTYMQGDEGFYFHVIEDEDKYSVPVSSFHSINLNLQIIPSANPSCLVQALIPRRFQINLVVSSSLPEVSRVYELCCESFVG
jgi:hypothetical protein